MLVLQPTDDGAVAAMVLGGASLTFGLVVMGGVRGHRIAAGVYEAGPGASPAA